MKSFTFGQFIPGDSFLHRLDPRTKLFASMALIFVVVVLKQIEHLLLFGLAIIIILILSRIPLKDFLRSIKLVLILLFFTMFANFFFTPGKTLVDLGIFRITDEGLKQGILMSQKLFYIVSVTSLVTLTTSPMSLIDGLQDIMRPFKRIGLPAEELAMMMVIALRFIPTLWEETDKIQKAQMSRGALFDSGNVMKRINNVTSLIIPILISAFRRADELALAMESRAYRVGIQRTRMKVMEFAFKDYFVMTIMVLLMLIAVLLRLI